MMVIMGMLILMVRHWLELEFRVGKPWVLMIMNNWELMTIM